MSRTEHRKGGRGVLAALRGRKGLVASEFALIAPIFFLIVLATTDIVRVFRAQIRMEMIAVQIGQIVSQCSRISTADFPELWGHAARIAGGLIDVNSTTGGATIVTVLSRNTNIANRVNWRQRTGNISVVSTFGADNNTNAIIRGRNAQAFVIPVGQTMFGTEVSAIIQPWTISAGLIGTALPRELYAVTMFLSRASDPARLQVAPTVSPNRDCTA